MGTWKISKTESGQKRRKKSKVLKGPQGKRFTRAQKQHALTLIASGMKRDEVSDVIGATVESLRRWVREAEAAGEMPVAEALQTVPEKNESVGKDTEPGEGKNESVVSGGIEGGAKGRSVYAPKDPGEGLSEAEQLEILELKKKRPSYGPAQIRAQLKRFKGWRVSIKAIAKVLKKNGYELVHRSSRPQGYEENRFEAPRRNALWQMDFCEFWVGREKMHLLVAEDDFSRFVVGHQLMAEKSSKAASAVLLEAMARHGKPEAVRTDRGGEFRASREPGSFGRVLESEEIDHIIGRSYHPQGGGKVESVIGTVRRELWEVEHFADSDEAVRRVAKFFEDYNHRRAHMGIDGLTPADRFFGRADRVLAAVDELSRKRQGASAMMLARGAPFEEVLGIGDGSPLEVLRLVIADGKMELRFCGARVCLGQVEER